MFVWTICFGLRLHLIFGFNRGDVHAGLDHLLPNEPSEFLNLGILLRDTLDLGQSMSVLVKCQQRVLDDRVVLSIAQCGECVGILEVIFAVLIVPFGALQRNHAS